MNWKKTLKSSSVPYEQELAIILKNDPQLCVEMLNDAILDEDPLDLVLALKDVVMAYAGIKEIAEKSGLTQKKLKSILASEDELDLVSFIKIIQALGWHVTFYPPEQTSRKAPRKAVTSVPQKEIKKNIQVPGYKIGLNEIRSQISLGCKKK